MDEPQAREVFEFGDFLVDAEQRLLRSRADGEPIPLTPKVFETLLYLVQHRGELIDKATLMKAVWPNVVVEENNLNQAISALRKALGESAMEHRFIVTVPGRGYRFVAALRMRSTVEREPAAPASTAAAAATTATVRRRAPLPPPSYGLIALFVVVAAVAAWAIWWVVRDATTEPVTARSTNAVAGKLRIAILPFENLSPDPANAFFADGLHEEVLATLARRAPGLEVVSRTTMMGYRQNPRPVHQVAEELGASHVLEGTVRREARNVRMTLQLVDARSDRSLWSQNYDRTLSDALTLQSDVAAEVAAQLSVQFAGGTQLAIPPTRNPEAYDLYLKALLARQFVSPFAPIERFLEVDDLLSRSIALDPSFAAAYAQRATFRGAMFAFNYDVSEEQVRRIRADHDMTLRLAPHDPMTLAAEALYWGWVEREVPRAVSTFEAAQSSGLADPMFLASKAAMLLRLGRVDESVSMFDRLLILDPGNLFLVTASAGTLAAARNIKETKQVIDRGLERFPGDPTLHFLRGQLIFGYTGSVDEWRQALDRFGHDVPELALLDQRFNLLRFERRYADIQDLLGTVDTPAIRVLAGQASSGFFGVGKRPTALYRGWLALLLGQPSEAGRHGRAVLEFVSAQKETPWSGWFLRLLEAHGYALTGDRERAIAAARRAVELMPRSRDALGWMAATHSAAAALAWSDAHDEANALLEELSVSVPGPPPALITRDPLFAIPLAQHAGYRALAERLEEQMRGTGL